MSETNLRIDQFRKMASDDPSNAVAHFSLGREYLNAALYADALSSLDHVIELDPNISRAYQLSATALLKLGRRDEAIDRLTRGVKLANARGDMMPQTEMLKMLAELGVAAPELVGAKPAAIAVGEGQVHCKRCGRVAGHLAKPPFKNAFGQEIFDSTCTDCWREAIGLGTKVINELRLPLNDPQAQKVWDQHIREFLNL